MKVEHIHGDISVHFSGEPIEKLKADLGLKDKYVAPNSSLTVFVSDKQVIIKLEIIIEREKKNES